MAVNRPPTLSVGTRVNERYTVIAVVGQGGLGTVYQVRDDRFGPTNTYALKETFDLSEGAREQFGREARWLERIDHPNIPRVRHDFEWNNRLYLVMDFVSGENLEHKLLRGNQRPLAEADVIRWIVPICDALAYLHAQDPPIIHRDVKPANIIVTPGGRPALVDLGIAKEHQPGMPNITATFIRKAGTEGYAPPEQYTSNGTTGPWSDIYSLGATMYHLLTGRVPASAIERAALDGQLVAPRKLNPQISPGVEAIILRSLAIRPGDRFGSMREMLMALTSVARPEPAPVARPQPAPTCPRCGRAMLTPAPMCNACAAELQMRSGPLPPANGAGEVLRVAPRRAIQRPRRDSGKSPADSLPRATPPQLPSATNPGARASFPGRAGAGTQDAARSPRRPLLRSWQVISALVAVVLLTAGVLIGTHIFSLISMDESSPQATINGYLSALENHDYQRAYGYFSQTMAGTETYDQFASEQQATNAQLGDIASYTIGQPVSAGPDSNDVTVTINRKNSALPDTITYVVTLTNGSWLIDKAPNT